MAAWSDATTATALTMVKTDLGILQSSLYDGRLTQYILSAKDEIERQGVDDLADDIPDVQLVAAFAGWLWSTRDKEGSMPRFIRVMLNNRIFSAKMKAAE